MFVFIENWSIVSSGTPYTAPEMISACLEGEVYSHPHFENGTEVTTSQIIEIHGRTIYTISGTKYLLGNVDPEYQKAYPNRDLDGNNPIRFK